MRNVIAQCKRARTRPMGLSRHGHWWTLVAVSLATFMLLLDITVVNVALPAIQRALGAGFEDLQWVVDAYALALAALLLTAGSLADRYGRRLVFTLGLAAFSLASLACALAPSPLALTLARGTQGVGSPELGVAALPTQALQAPRKTASPNS